MRLFLFLILFSFIKSKVFFFEPFDDDTLGLKWIPSKSPHFNGTWSIEERKNEVYELGDKGLVMKSPKSFHGITARANINPENRDFVLQYDVKLQETPYACGGAYIKLFGGLFEQEVFDEKTRYLIMFGPDRCGATNQVHFILQKKNAISGEWVEHKLANPPQGKFDNLTHVYTLVLKTDETFKIKIDSKTVAEGMLNDSTLFDPPFQPPLMIDDPSDKKPSDWEDEKEIDDPEDIKPEYWDEDEPEFILDPFSRKPDSWDEDQPFYIPDPNATKPELWDDEKDGQWEAPMIENPECMAHGCGPWTPIYVKNPRFLGKFVPRKIPNPKYIGEWKPRKIDNPNYYVPRQLHQLQAIRAVGFDVLSDTKDVLFDNVLICDDEKEAAKIVEERWIPRYAAEYKDWKKKAQINENAELKIKLKRIMRTEGLKNKLKMGGELLLEWGSDHYVKLMCLVSFATLLVTVPIAVCVVIAIERHDDRVERERWEMEQKMLQQQKIDMKKRKEEGEKQKEKEEGSHKEKAESANEDEEAEAQEAREKANIIEGRMLMREAEQKEQEIKKKRIEELLKIATVPKEQKTQTKKDEEDEGKKQKPKKETKQKAPAKVKEAEKSRIVEKEEEKEPTQRKVKGKKGKGKQ